MIKRSIGIVLACASWTACSLGTEPELSGETYALAEVGGASLPVQVAGETWIADTIRFDGDGEWSRVEVVVLHYEGAGPDPVRREGGGFVTRIGDRIVLDFVCPPNALCVAPDTLRPAGEGLERRANRYGSVPQEDPVFRYGRVR